MSRMGLVTLNSMAFVFWLAAPAAGQTREENVARCAEFNKTPDLAIGACTALIQSGKETTAGLVTAFINRGNAYDNNGDTDRALRDYETALKLDPTSSSAYFNRGITYHGMKDLDRALQDENKAIELRSDYASAFVERASILFNLGQYDKALSDVARAEQIGVRNVEPPLEDRARKVRADIEHGQRCIDPNADQDLKIGGCSAVILAAANMSKPPLATAYNNRAVAYAAKRDYTRAYEDSSQAIALNSSEKVYFVNRGINGIWTERYDDATRDFERALAIDPQYATAINGQGLLARQRGNYPLAVQKFTDALRLTPGQATFTSNRGIAYLLMGQLDQALTDLNAALAINSKEAYALFARGVLKCRNGDRAGGDADMAAAARLQPDIVAEMKRRHVEPPAG